MIQQRTLRTTEKQNALTHDRLTDVLDYCPETGEFSWKVATSPRVSIGKAAGTQTRE